MKCNVNLENINLILIIVIVGLLIYYNINKRENFEATTSSKYIPTHHSHPHAHGVDGKWPHTHNQVEEADEEVDEEEVVEDEEETEATTAAATTAAPTTAAPTTVAPTAAPTTLKPAPTTN